MADDKSAIAAKPVATSARPKLNAWSSAKAVRHDKTDGVRPSSRSCHSRRTLND